MCRRSLSLVCGHIYCSFNPFLWTLVWCDRRHQRICTDTNVGVDENIQRRRTRSGRVNYSNARPPVPSSCDLLTSPVADGISLLATWRWRFVDVEVERECAPRDGRRRWRWQRWTGLGCREGRRRWRAQQSDTSAVLSPWETMLHRKQGSAD
jgi:hypothetical protein